MEITAAAAPHRVRHEEHEPLPWGIKFANLTAVVLPVAALAFVMYSLWGDGFNWLYLGLMAGMYLFTAIGITAGYHRLFTHRSFETNRFVTAALAIAGGIAVEGTLLWWVAMHRRHHQHADEENDPHSPHLHGEGYFGLLRGIWHSHIGWLFAPTPVELKRYVGDLQRDRMLNTISWLFPLWVFVGFATPAVIAGLVTKSWWGAFLGFVWGGPVRVFFVHHVTWSINSVCHFWGSQPFKGDDESRNNPIFGVLAMGEGWHNNHHAFPTSARHGLWWWQFDATYWFIKGLELCGLAWKVKTPTQQAIAEKMARAGAA